MELIGNGSGCSWEHRLSYGAWDINGNIKPGEILRLVQEISLVHPALLNMDDDFFLEKRRAFMLAELGLRIIKQPKKCQDVLIISRPEDKPTHARYKRATVILDKDTKEELIRVDARWILVNLDTGRIERKEQEGIVFPKQEEELFSLSVKIPKGDYGETVGEGVRTVGYSMMDTNKHLNNTFYADMIADALPFEEFEKGRKISEMIISFRNQGLFGDEIKVSCLCDKDICLDSTDNAEKCFYIRGDRLEENIETEKNPFYFEGYVVME